LDRRRDRAQNGAAGGLGGCAAVPVEESPERRGAAPLGHRLVLAGRAAGGGLGGGALGRGAAGRGELGGELCRAGLGGGP
jgi:hypothetical protein